MSFARLDPRRSFLTLPYAQQWAHCDRLLSTLVDDEQLGADVERLVGETTLAEVRAAQTAYGDALGITTARQATDAVSLAMLVVQHIGCAAAEQARQHRHRSTGEEAAHRTTS